jgi:hypothetical protein
MTDYEDWFSSYHPYSKRDEWLRVSIESIVGGDAGEKLGIDMCNRVKEY